MSACVASRPEVRRKRDYGSCLAPFLSELASEVGLVTMTRDPEIGEFTFAFAASGGAYESIGSIAPDEVW